MGGVISPSRAYQPRGWRGVGVRVSSGLLYEADFTQYPDGLVSAIPALVGVWRLKWDPKIPQDAQIVGGKLRIVDGNGGSGNYMGVVCDAVAPRGEQVVQAGVSRSYNTMSVYVGARYTEATTRQQYSVTYENVSRYCYLSVHVWGISDGASGALLAGPPAAVAEGRQRLKIHVRDSFQRAWVNAVLIGSAAHTGNNGANGSPAIFINTPRDRVEYVEVDEFIVCASNSIEVTNVPAGAVLKCGTSISPEAVGGKCVLDLAGATFPAVVEVLLRGVVIGTIGDVYGGDTWRFI